MDFLSRNILAVLLPFSVLFSKPSWQKKLGLAQADGLVTNPDTVTGGSGAQPRWFCKSFIEAVGLRPAAPGNGIGIEK